MAICVISTVGASVFTQANEDIRGEWKPFDQEKGLNLHKVAKETHDFPGKDLYTKSINYLKAIAHSPNAEAGLARASAELKSLSYILKGRQPNNNDILYFLATDTPAGTLSARIISDFTSEYFGIATEVVRVEGLQVENDVTFNARGIRNLISRVYDRLEKADKSVYRRVLNPTGGYKGVVPYLTLVGMIEPDVEISYIFETSTTLITLRRIPISIDFDTLRVAHDALVAANRDFIPESRLAELLDIEPADLNQHPAMALFDEDDRQYSVNGLGIIVLRSLGGKNDNEVFLSEQAKKAFDKLDPNKQERYASYFDGAASSAWLRTHRHERYENKSGAIPLKISRTDERVWVYAEGNKILVAELTKHAPNGSYEIEPKDRQVYTYASKWETVS